jgi:hypothetical protein
MERLTEKEIEYIEKTPEFKSTLMRLVREITALRIAVVDLSMMNFKGVRLDAFRTNKK